MFEFKLPEIGEGVIEGEVVRWLRQPGESIAANQALVEVMTDKATIEIPSPIDGVVSRHAASEGDICAIGAVICEIDKGAKPAATQIEQAAAPSAPAPSTPSPAAPSAVAPPAPVPAGPARSSDLSVPATPAARHLARESDIDLSSIPLDARGRITKKDVISATERRDRNPVPAPSAAPVPSRPVASGPSDADVETLPFRGIRRTIAEALTRSYREAVHFTYVEQLDVTQLVKLRDRAKKSAAESGVSLNYLPFIIKAVCHALKRYSIVNARLDADAGQIVINKRYHIGVAAATDKGLMVPVIRDADRLSLLDIAREIVRLGEAAREGKLKPEELSGATFTVSSLGAIGGLLATPIINHPEVGILGVHAIRKTPVVDADDQIVVGHQMNLSGSFDHRVVDGFEGASFLQEVRRYLEDPTLLLLAGT